MPRKSSTEQPIRVTTARGSKLDDQQRRMVRYLVMMLIRFACFGLLFVTPDPWRYLWVVGAIVLPYIAVIAANQGGEAHPGSLPELHVNDEKPTQQVVLDTSTTDLVVITGEIIEAHTAPPKTS